MMPAPNGNHAWRDCCSDGRYRPHRVRGDQPGV